MNLALTPALLSWLSQDPSWRDRPMPWRLAQHWRAMWGGVNLRLSEAQDAGAEALTDPVLIVGPWRSGTTVLHELLTAASGCPTPLTWQCMDAPAFRLSRRPPAAAKIARPMDGLAIGPLSPQEDEFALLAMGVDSAYRAFFMPHRLPELGHTLDPDFWLGNAAWMDRWEPFLRAVLRSAALPERPMILKSPNHSFRVPAILRRFPATRLVWTLREPAEVMHSNRKMWRAMFDAHGLGSRASSDLDGFLSLALRRTAEVLRWCMHELPAAQWTVCEQDELRADPVQTVAKIGTALGLPLQVAGDDFSAALSSTAAGRIDRYAEPDWGAEVESALNELQAAQSEAAHRVRQRA